MKTTTLNGHDYELVIIDGDIVAQSLEQDIIFEDAYILIKDMLGKEHDKHFRNRFPSGLELSRSEYIANEMEETIEWYCKNNLDSVKIEVHQNN